MASVSACKCEEHSRTHYSLANAWSTCRQMLKLVSKRRLDMEAHASKWKQKQTIQTPPCVGVLKACIRGCSWNRIIQVLSCRFWEFPNLVVSNLVVCNFHVEAPFCTLLRVCVSFCAHLYRFASFCVRLRLEWPRGNLRKFAKSSCLLQGVLGPFGPSVGLEWRREKLSGASRPWSLLWGLPWDLLRSFWPPWRTKNDCKTSLETETTARERKHLGLESAKTDPVRFKWGFGEGGLKGKFAFFEAYKNPIPKRRKLLAKRPFL